MVEPLIRIVSSIDDENAVFRALGLKDMGHLTVRQLCFLPCTTCATWFAIDQSVLENRHPSRFSGRVTWAEGIDFACGKSQMMIRWSEMTKSKHDGLHEIWGNVECRVQPIW
jgi:hypothetical protein